MFLLSALLATPALALQQDLSLPELAALAEQVVVGEVTSTEALWAPGDVGFLETTVFLALDDGRDLELVVTGGQRGVHRTGSSDAPTLVEDHRYVLLLVHDDQGRWRVLGGQRGALEVRSDAVPRAPTVDAVRTVLRDTP